jgi:hypothetical protein
MGIIGCVWLSINKGWDGVILDVKDLVFDLRSLQDTRDELIPSHV